MFWTPNGRNAIAYSQMRVWYANTLSKSSRCSTFTSTMVSLFVMWVQNTMWTVQLQCINPSWYFSTIYSDLHCPRCCHNRQHRPCSAWHISLWWCQPKTWNMWPCNYKPNVTWPTLHIHADSTWWCLQTYSPLPNQLFLKLHLLYVIRCKSVTKKVAENHVLQYYLLAYLKFIIGKEEKLVAHGVATMQVSPTRLSFLIGTRNNSWRNIVVSWSPLLAKKKNSKNT